MWLSVSVTVMVPFAAYRAIIIHLLGTSEALPLGFSGSIRAEYPDPWGLERLLHLFLAWAPVSLVRWLQRFSLLLRNANTELGGSTRVYIQRLA